MSYNDGITINGKHSYNDYNLNINSRKIDLPPKRSIKKTVPFMNGAYDFTKLNGAVTWGERSISYTFDIVGSTVEEMDAERTRIVNIYCNMDDVDIYDDTIPDYHFHGSFDSASQNEDGEKTELTIVFLCYPFMIANKEEYYISSDYNWSKEGVTVNQPVSLCVDTSQDCTISVERASQIITQAVMSGDHRLAITLKNGDNINITKENELVYPFQEKSHTENGITWTVNEDGTVIANGTATDISWCYLRGSAQKFVPPFGKHTLKGCPAGGGTDYRFQVYRFSEADPQYYYDNGSGVTFEVTEETEYLSIAIRISKGVTANNLTFKPQLFGQTKIYWSQEVL